MSRVVLSNEKLLSTKKASELTGYSQDYLGQLCRNKTLECRFIGRQWYVLESSLKSYAPKMRKPKKGDYYKQQSNDLKNSVNNTRKVKSVENNKVATKTKEELIIKDTKADLFEINGELYVSTKKASELTGYSQDYVGQLARSKEVKAIKSGKKWFVHKKELLEHKKQKDTLLAKVQSDSVGLNKNKIYNYIPYSLGNSVDLDIDYLGAEEVDDPFDIIGTDDSFKIEYLDVPDHIMRIDTEYSIKKDNNNNSLNPKFDYTKLDKLYKKDVDIINRNTNLNKITDNTKAETIVANAINTNTRKTYIWEVIKLIISITMFIITLSMFIATVWYIYL